MSVKDDIIAWNYPDRNMDDEITLAGSLRKYWPKISQKWIAERTINENIQDYQKRILRCADPLKAFSDYTEDDFKRIVDNLSSENEYKEGTRQHYEHLIQLIVEVNIQFGEKVHPSLKKDESSKESESSGRKRLVKSFTSEENRRLEKWLNNLKADTVTGPELGVAFMFVLGLRNHEAAGLKFASIIDDDLLDIKMCRITQTMKGKTRETKIKGKTVNAHRELPVFSTFLEKLIHERWLYVIKETELSDVSMLPICCGKTIYDHCTYDEITQCADKLFKDLDIVGSSWESFGVDADELEEVKQEESTPTAYALRRNAATRYYGLNLTEADLHYVMGHAINVTGIQRSDYMNSETMGPLVKKLKQHSFYKENERNA